MYTRHLPTLHCTAGDDSITAAQVGQRAGLDPALLRGKQTPQDKLQRVRAAGKVMAMVGDGVN